MSMRGREQVEPGAVYAVPTGAGEFGAVRILRVAREDNMVLVAITPWLAPGPPAMDAPEVMHTLREFRGRYDGTLAISWFTLPVPDTFVPLGVVDVSREKAQDSEENWSYRGRLHDSIIYYVGVELRDGEPSWHKPRPSGLPLSHAQPSAVVSAMDADVFWGVIDNIDLEAKPTPLVTKGAIDRLGEFEEALIRGFHEFLAECLFRLDGRAWAIASGLDPSDETAFSPDHFLDLRCLVVARGRRFFEAVREDPSQMPNGDAHCEALLSVAASALEMKTGTQVEIPSEYDCETYANVDQW